MREFMDFLKEYKVMGLAIAIVMGMAANDLVKSLVTNIIMPLATPFLSGGTQNAVLVAGPFVITWGAFLGAVINFVIIAFAVFLLAKMLMKEDKVAKK